jgi:hypothetical protein
MWHALPRPVQSSNMSYGTTPSVFHLTMYYSIPQPVYFSWQCVMRYHNHYSITYCHVKYTGCVTVWRIDMLHWSWYRMAHCHVALVVVPYDTLPGARHWSWCVFHMAICHTVPRPVSFTWQCVIRYHDQCLSHGTKAESSNHINFCYYLALIVRDNLLSKFHRSIYTETTW